MIRRTMVMTALVAAVGAGCGSGDDAPSADPVCTAWTSMTDAQPGNDFDDDEARRAAYSAFADVIADAIPAFGEGAAETLRRYEAAMRTYAADPSDAAAVEGLSEMIVPMSELAAGIAGICGIDVAEGR